MVMEEGTAEVGLELAVQRALATWHKHRGRTRWPVYARPRFFNTATVECALLSV